jgi:glucose/arabinose dehydrogenase
MKKVFFLILAVLFPTQGLAGGLPLDQLSLPPGFQIEVYAEVPGARQMAAGAPGIVYVGSRRLGKVHAVVDSNGDHRADRVLEIADGLAQPSGVSYRDGNLYVAAISRILRYDDIDARLDAPPEPRVVIDTLPSETHHGWKFIDFGPDGLLYVPVGVPCNICLPEDHNALILRLDVDDPKPEVVARGVRNSVGFDWHPQTGELWFTENGRDMLGDEEPSCELNRVTAPGQHFGYPYFHADGQPDPEFGDKGGAAGRYVEPELLLGPHVAPLGMIFYTGSMLPFRGEFPVLIAEHGSWNRSEKAGHTGHRVVLVTGRPGQLRQEVLVEGWLGEDNKAWGRPADLLQLDDGSVLIADDKAGVLYRLSHAENQTHLPESGSSL